MIYKEASLGPWQAEARALPWGQRLRRSNTGWEKWRGALAPEMDGHRTKPCMRGPTPPPHGPNGQVLSVSEAEGLALQGPRQKP